MAASPLDEDEEKSTSSGIDEVEDGVSYGARKYTNRLYRELATNSVPNASSGRSRQRSPSSDSANYGGSRNRYGEDYKRSNIDYRKRYGEDYKSSNKDNRNLHGSEKEGRTPRESYGRDREHSRDFGGKEVNMTCHLSLSRCTTCSPMAGRTYS